MAITPKNMTDFSDATLEWHDAYLGHMSKFPVMDLDDRLRRLEEQMLIVAPPIDQISKYPALKEAYDHYKLIERLVLSKNN